MQSIVWKDIKNYEGLYKISNLGNVYSIVKNKILKPTNNGNNYLIIGLRKNHIRKNHYIHRLVAEAFIPNPNNYKEINHLDYNKKNNVIDNLSWCTRKENVNYSKNNMKHKKSITHSNTNEKYITYSKSKNVFRVIINKKEKTFKNINDAIKYRNKVLNGGD